MFNVKGDIKPITKHLNKLHKKQIPFAAAQAINNTLFDVMKAQKAQLPKKLDRPTPFTMKAFKVNKAKKTELVGDIHVTPERYKYLKYAIEGGTRTGNIGVPTRHAKLNKYGNIPQRRKGLIKNKNQFIGKFNNISGVYERGHYSKKGSFTTQGKSASTALKLVVAFEKSVTYKKQFPFYKIAEGVARKKFQRNFKQALTRAIRTAK
tara:strand:- start:39 stop:659 length:621 start_codon:yes stop_codon:yes gene_type:complete